jgi:HSP20 family protein
MRSIFNYDFENGMEEKMANIVRWDPMQDSMDRFFDDYFGRYAKNTDGYGDINVNLVQTKDNVIVKASVPGVKPEDLDISITGDTLTIRGETKEDEETKDGNYHIKEMRYGSFARSILLPNQIVVDKAVAEFKDGVLKLTLPKAEEVKPKAIKIKAK